MLGLQGRGRGAGRALPCAPALEGSLPAASPDKHGCGELQGWEGSALPPVQTSAAP